MAYHCLVPYKFPNLIQNALLSVQQYDTLKIIFLLFILQFLSFVFCSLDTNI